MAMTAYLDIDQGSDFTTSITLQNDDGTVMDLTGFAIYSQFRKSYQSTAGYTFDTSIDILNGTIKLELLGEISSTIKPGRYLYDVELHDANNNRLRLIEGIVTISPEITKIP